MQINRALWLKFRDAGVSGFVKESKQEKAKATGREVVLLNLNTVSFRRRNCPRC